MDKINEENCPIQHLGDLYLPEDTVSHLPDIKDININPVFPNRTALLHLHNMALSRSFFWSYILQSRFIRPAINDTYDPGMMYYFLSTVADVSANPHILLKTPSKTASTNNDDLYDENLMFNIIQRLQSTTIIPILFYRIM